jgi:hypothetical protein
MVTGEAVAAVIKQQACVAVIAVAIDAEIAIRRVFSVYNPQYFQAFQNSFHLRQFQIYDDDLIRLHSRAVIQ